MITGKLKGFNTALVQTLIATCLLAAGTCFADNSGSLRDIFADNFLVGAALNQRQITGIDQASHEFIAAQFSALTAENAMKWQRIQPQEGQFNWEHADALVALAAGNDIHVTGHTLVWHLQTPDWVFEDADGSPASRELVLSRMNTHIDTVVGRYKGQVKSWDVVNEAVNEDGTPRDSRWRQLVGDDFLQKAFEFAAAADPDAKLYYNDYNLYKPTKRAGVVKLLRALQQSGARVDGVGMQAHYSLDNPADLADVQASINAFAAAGVDVLITELDVSVLPRPAGDDNINGRFAYNPEFDPYRDGLPEAVEQQLNNRYAELMALFLRNSDKISRVTLWGVHDAQSWKNNWPMIGRTDYPLLFDRENQPKSVISRIADLKQ